MKPITAAEIVIATLNRNGFEAFLVGGCVRDTVLGRTPKDFDVTTNATPEQVAALFDKTLEVGASFGVVVVIIEEIQIEVATFRTDGQYSDARRPDSVSFSTSAKEDVVRRDFTINGLLMNNGEVVDHVGGLEDIGAEVIRAIGNPEARFTEDALRMLRAVRFAAQLGFEIEEETFNAIVLLRANIQHVSRERVAVELIKIVTAPFAGEGILALIGTGLLEEIFTQEFVAATSLPRLLTRFRECKTTDPVKGLAMFFANSLAGVREAVNSLKLSNEVSTAVLNAVATPEELLTATSTAARKRLARKPGFFVGLDLFEQNGGVGTEFFRKLTPEEINPAPFVTGRDLIAQGLKPGPLFGRLLNTLETAQLNGEITTREEAETFLRAFAEGA